MTVAEQVEQLRKALVGKQVVAVEPLNKTVCIFTLDTTVRLQLCEEDTPLES